MSDDTSAQNSPDCWPSPEPGQVEVMLLGLYHMDNPGLDAVNIEADDVLAPERQAELRELADRLEPWAPDRVAVERPYDGADELNAVYEEYRDGERAYDREEAFESTHSMRDDADTECRSEVVQVGFRLADRLDHDRVYPVDDPMTLGNAAFAALEERGFEPERKVPVDLPDQEAHQRLLAERLARSSIPEYVEWLNRDVETLRFNDDWLFGDYLRYGEGENFGGPKMLATWYDRNLRMVHNVWRAIDGPDERVLLAVGSSHVTVLKRLFDLSPTFCPVSPLPYLEAE